MATHLDDLTAIRSHFITTWKASNPDVPFLFDNEAALKGSPPIWARFAVRPGEQVRRSIGDKSYQQRGRIYLQVFVSRSEGVDAEGWQIANTMVEAFRDWRSSDYRIYTFTPDFRVYDEDGEPLLITVSIQYSSDH